MRRGVMQIDRLTDPLPSSDEGSFRDRLQAITDNTQLSLFENDAICYFLWDRDNEGDCTVTSIHNGKTTTTTRVLNEFDTFIRYSEALSVIEKVRKHTSLFYNEKVSSQKPFGLRTYVKPTESGDIMLRYGGGIGKFNRSDVLSSQHWIDKYKVIMSYLT